MRNWSHNEEQLRRWIPRRPSPRLQARVFGQPALAQTAARTLGDFSRWLVPAFGCFVLAIGSLSDRWPNNPAVVGGSVDIVMAEARRLSEINAFPVTKMERSLTSSLAQPASHTLTSYTNKLIQQ